VWVDVGIDPYRDRLRDVEDAVPYGAHLRGGMETAPYGAWCVPLPALVKGGWLRRAGGILVRAIDNRPYMILVQYYICI